MFSNLLYKTLLKLSKEYDENNYIYSDIDFPEGFIKQKTKREREERMIKSKNLYTFDRFLRQKNSKNSFKDNVISLNTKRKKIKLKKNDKNFCQRLTLINKNKNITFYSLPKVNYLKNQNFNNKDKKYSQNNIKNSSSELTPIKKQSIDFEKNINNKEYSNLNANLNKEESNSSINIHILNINNPSDKFKKDLLSISRNILSQKKYIDEKKSFNKMIQANKYDNKNIQLKKKELSENNYYKSKDMLLEKLQSRINFKIHMNPKNRTIKINKNDNDLSFTNLKPFTIKKYPSKLYPMILIQNHREKYLLINSIENLVFKEKEEFPLFKKLSFSNNDIYYYVINKMYVNQIKEYMKHRINWEYASDKQIKGVATGMEQKNINFSWRYNSNRIYFKKYKYDPKSFNNGFSVKKLKMINLLERNYEIGNKKYMFLNLINYCDKINMNVFEIVPFTVIINNSPDVEYSLDLLKEIITFVDKNSNIKNDLITNRKYNEHFWFDKNYENINKQYIYINKNFLSDKNYWIVKPTDLYQGKCIDIFNNFEQIYKKCKNIFRGVDKRIKPDLSVKEEDDSDNDSNNDNTKNNYISDNNEYINKKKIIYSRMYCSNEIIIQKYLDNPLLYNNRKFDIRCFVLVDYNLNIYFFREGHLKASSELYNINDKNKFIHITNYSLQKKSSKFETYEEGNEISYNDFKQFMISNNISLNNFDNMIKQMKLLVEISMKSVGKKFRKTNPVLSFEIFGYDFIIDNEFKPWILEINNNPGLVISSPVIQKIIPRMLDDAFRLTIDKIFETKYAPECIDENGNYKSKYKLDGFSDDENVFEFLCNIK